MHAQDAPPGTGEALVRVLAERYVGRGRAYLDLSVMHDNEARHPRSTASSASPGSRRSASSARTRSTPRCSPPGRRVWSELNPYARIIAEEALRRGIRVEVTDAECGEMRLSIGGRTVPTLESLSEFTTRRGAEPLRRQAGHPPDHGAGRRPGGPRGRACEGDLAAAAALLAEVGAVVVKPARGEQGRGHHRRACATRPASSGRSPSRCSSAPTSWSRSWSTGEDLRVIVIDRQVVAAAVRRPAEIVGDGRHTVADLVRSTSRRRERATGGESRIPLDDATAEVVAEAGYAMDDVPPERAADPRPADGEPAHRRHDRGRDRRGCTPRSPTPRCGPPTALGIPVTGLDFLVPDVEGPDYVFIEANERPGLANHEPQPVVERFVDLLFPETRRR